MAKALMIVGTGSDVGKSIVATVLCKYFAARGISVAYILKKNLFPIIGKNKCLIDWNNG
ncbi:MAG: hypothetical protein SVO01_05105 [Thermotogota bacterium]|nr:hypothetical protein [Thermotogota bacterium]